MGLSEQIELHGESFNFGPRSLQNHSVIDLVKEMSLHWKRVSWNDVSKVSNGPYESNLLKLNCDKALHYLNWYAVMDFEDTVKMTVDWYKQYYESSCSIREITINQIKRYTIKANNIGLDWAN
jgi:CDP-glucose 4,6-dehydratase